MDPIPFPVSRIAKIDDGIQRGRARWRSAVILLAEIRATWEEDITGKTATHADFVRLANEIIDLQREIHTQRQIVDFLEIERLEVELFPNDPSRLMPIF